jgi:hypothetical protein
MVRYSRSLVVCATVLGCAPARPPVRAQQSASAEGQTRGAVAIDSAQDISVRQQRAKVSVPQTARTRTGVDLETQTHIENVPSAQTPEAATDGRDDAYWREVGECMKRQNEIPSKKSLTGRALDDRLSCGEDSVLPRGAAILWSSCVGFDCDEP